MPFDNTSGRKSEIDILTEMEITLARPEYWCRDILCRRDGNLRQYCLYGALNLADHGYPEWLRGMSDWDKFATPEAIKVHEYMMRLTGPWYRPFQRDSAVKYNNSHSHAEVLDLIRRAKTHFQQSVLV